MTELDWEQLRDLTIDRFQGQVPRAEDEADIIQVFEQHPTLVIRAIDETATALAEGKITWAWSVLKSRLERGTTAIRNAKPDTSGDTQRRIENAKRWIENAGLYYDLQHQVEAELFGDEYQRGRLNGIDLTDTQREDLLDHWRQHRPRGEQAEDDHEAWNAECAGNRERVTEILKRKKEARCSTDSESDTDSGESPAGTADIQTATTSPAEPVTVGADDDILW